MKWLEHMAAGMAARQFLIVQPRETRYESITYRSRMEAALETAMPGYIFTVTIEHPQLHNDTALRHPKYIMNC